VKNIVEDARQIVCVLPKGKALALKKALIEQHGIHAADFHHARGVRQSSLTAKGLGEQRQKDVLHISVDKELADEIFEFVYFEAEINKLHSGIVYMVKTPRMTRMTLPEIEEKN